MIRAWFAMLCLALAGWPAQAAETLRMAADNWCPYTCDSRSDKPGFMVELLRAILEPDGYRIEYHIMPWERALTEAVLGKIDGVIGIDHGEVAEGDLIFNSVSAGFQEQVIAFRRGEGGRYHQPSDLDRLSVGVVQGYHYTDEIDAWIEAHKNQQHHLQILRGENAAQLNVQKLMAGRIDATIDARYVINYYLLGVPEEARPDLVSVDPGTAAYFGFSTQLSAAPRLTAAIDRGIARMRDSGALAAILKRYGLTDWEAPKPETAGPQ